MAYHNYYAEISEMDCSLSREENLLKLKEALRKWRKRQSTSARVVENLVLEAISVFGNPARYEQFRRMWESKESQREPNREDQFRSLVLGAASDGEITQVEYRWLLEEARAIEMDPEAARTFISTVAGDVHATIVTELIAPEAAEIARFRIPLAVAAAMDCALLGVFLGMLGRWASVLAFIAMPAAIGLAVWRWAVERSGRITDSSELKKLAGAIGGWWMAALYFAMAVGLLIGLWMLCWRVPIAGALFCGLLAGGGSALLCAEPVLVFQTWNRMKKSSKALLDWRRHVIPSLAFGAILLLLVVVLSAFLGVGWTILVVTVLGTALAVVDHYLARLRV